MSNILLLLICLIIGLLLQKLKSLPKDAHLVLNIIILHVPLPAIALLSIPNLEWELSLMYLCLVPWIIFAISYFLFSFLGKRGGWEKSVIGCLIITAGLGNTSFVGFPIIEALFGKEALRYAILLDQPGSFLIVSSVGIWVAAQFSSAKLGSRELLKKVLLFPPFIGFFGALILGLAGWRAEGTTQIILERLSMILTPLALISVGLQLRLKEIKDDIWFLSYGLGFKLILAPAVIFILYSLLGIEKKLFQISVMEAAMAPMITASILAASQNLQPKLAGSMVGVGVPLSFLTLGIWYFFI
jgi:malate permease and related proteins